MPLSKASKPTLGSEGELDHHIDGRISCRSYAGSLVRDKGLLYAHGTYSHSFYPSQPRYGSAQS